MDYSIAHLLYIEPNQGDHGSLFDAFLGNLDYYLVRSRGDDM